MALCGLTNPVSEIDESRDRKKRANGRPCEPDDYYLDRFRPARTPDQVTPRAIQIIMNRRDVNAEHDQEDARNGKRGTYDRQGQR